MGPELLGCTTINWKTKCDDHGLITYILITNEKLYAQNCWGVLAL